MSQKFQDTQILEEVIFLTLLKKQKKKIQKCALLKIYIQN